MDDFFDGTKFRELVQKYGLAIVDAFMLALSTDGVCVANKRHSVLPLFLKVLNFPPSLRVKYFSTILWGIVPLSSPDELKPREVNQRPAHLGPVGVQGRIQSRQHFLLHLI